MKILIIAPHQDDEILAAGGFIQHLLKDHHSVSVLFATNGDYLGKEIAQKRYFESLNALRHLGIPETRIFCLGYGDTGMSYSHSFLRKLFFSEKNQECVTPSSTTTYHPANGLTVHALQSGKETYLTHASFTSDLSWFINQYMPDLLITPHFKDLHGDHAIIYYFLQEINAFSTIPICFTYLIHGGNDAIWPNKSKKSFEIPPIITSDMWKTRIVISLNEKERKRKLETLKLFKTQLISDSTEFLLSFAKKEEIFFPLEHTIYPTKKM